MNDGASIADVSLPAGRGCPVGHRHAPAALARAADATCDVLYVVGGLYGNTPALDRIVEAFERESGSKRLVFNGDFNWFDVEPARFEALNRRVLAFDALRGNVETELADAESDAGCGCAYPAWVDDGTVARSNRIMRRLQTTAALFPALRDRLVGLPTTRRVDVGGLRVAVVHGDAESLSGWGFAQESLRDAAHRRRVEAWFDVAAVDVFASSHTCLPMLAAWTTAAGGATALVVNNGAAGMPNFEGDGSGLFTRISTTPCEGHLRRHGTTLKRVFVDAVAIPFDTARWHDEFLAQWAPGSEAHVSYWDRLAHGPDYRRRSAVLEPSGIC